MTEDDVLRLMTGGESQTLEFKPSLGQGAQAEGTESLVAFANREGGKALFGVANDGTLRGVTVGDSTLENLANFITSHTYPSLPAHVEEVRIAGRSVVVAEAPSDRPPVIGLYLFSSSSLSLDDSVPAAELKALRRVGRTNQTADLMWLRADMPTDPRLRINVMRRRWIPEDEGIGDQLRARVWIEQGSASAHEISVRTEPPVFLNDETLGDLPTPYTSGGGGIMRTDSPPAPARLYGWETFEDVVMGRDTKVPSCDYWLVSTYSDDLGISWQSRRRIEHQALVIERQEHVQQVPGKFSRRIIMFPAKRAIES